MAAMRFTKVRLVNWKNFQDVEVQMPARAFLIGPNAVGKSNFLDALRFLGDVARPGGGLQNACSARGGVSQIRCLSARSVKGLGIEVEMQTGQILWEYQVYFTQESISNRKNVPVIMSEKVLKNGELLLERPNENDNSDRIRLTQTALEQVNFNQAFRDITDFFSSISYLHLVPQIVRTPALANDPMTPAIYGGRFLERIAKTNERTRDARLKKIAKAMAFAIPNMVGLSLKRDDSGAPHLEASLEYWRPNPFKQDESQFSDGTLRLIGLLWLLEDGEGPLLLEEPELSLNSGLVRQLTQVLHRANSKKKRQLIISTHSADMLSDAGIGGHETLLFTPGKEGTKVALTSDIKRIHHLLDSGLTIAEAAMPETEPTNVIEVVSSYA
jgi:predicted ATPase